MKFNLQTSLEIKVLMYPNERLIECVFGLDQRCKWFQLFHLSSI